MNLFTWVSVVRQSIREKIRKERHLTKIAALFIPVGSEAVVLVVADGAGGLPAGGQASGLAVEAIRQRLTQHALSEGKDGSDASGLRGSLRGIILDAIETAHTAISNLGVGAGTTLAVVEIHMLNSKNSGNDPKAVKLPCESCHPR